MGNFGILISDFEFALPLIFLTYRRLSMLYRHCTIKDDSFSSNAPYNFAAR